MLVLKHLLLIFNFSIFAINVFSVEMILEERSMSSGQILIPCSVDLIEYECLFDSGAKNSYLPFVGFENYQKVGKAEANGAAGIRVKYDEIVIDDLTLGDFSQPNFKVRRASDLTAKGLKIGNGFFKNSSLYFNFKEREIESKSIPHAEPSKHPLKTLEGRPLVDVVIHNDKLLGVWDTGASMTVVDQDYINRNPKAFTYMWQKVNGTDATGNQISLNLYILDELSIQGLSFDQVFVVGMDFVPMRREGFPQNINFIIGYNIIVKKNWYFDYINKLWAVEE